MKRKKYVKPDAYSVLIPDLMVTLPIVSTSKGAPEGAEGKKAIEAVVDEDEEEEADSTEWDFSPLNTIYVPF